MNKRKRRTVAVYEGHMIATLKTFTDCILSIIATIMVLEIPLPVLLHNGRYDFAQTSNSLIIFFISFLVILSFYFEIIKFFTRIQKITGWQIFAYVLFLMVASLFPFMTQVDNSVHPYLFTIVYVLYIVGCSRLLSLIRYRVYKMNKVERQGRMRQRPLDLIVMTIIIIVAARFVGNYAGYAMLYLPIRSLISSVVYDEEDEE